MMKDNRKPGIRDTGKKPEWPAYLLMCMIIALVIPPYIWLARQLWEWALS